MQNRGEVVLHPSSSALLLILLLLTDFVFIVLYIIKALTPLLDNPFLSISNDNGYPELFQYIKWFWVVVLLVYLAIKQRSFSYIAWVIFFLYLLLDDCIGIHEHAGHFFAQNITITASFGLRLQDIGELIVTGIASSILLSIVFVAYFFGTREFKQISHNLLLLIFALAFFGVFVDMLHIVVNSGMVMDVIFAVFEDGGEMIVASIACWYVFHQVVQEENELANSTTKCTTSSIRLHS